jgi:hypothetical protein
MECIKVFTVVQKNMNVNIKSRFKYIYLCIRVLADLDQVIKRAFQSGLEKVFYSFFVMLIFFTLFFSRLLLLRVLIMKQFKH